ncbi:MAG: CoA ester lyase [Sulfurimonas sp.]|nr:MAG: CoA ester lyase [Sulfurimonas sp.]
MPTGNLRAPEMPLTCDHLATSLIPRERTLNRMRHYRSVLMLSAHNRKHLSKIPDLEADSVMLNLEDGVDVSLKPLALQQCAWTLSQLPQCSKKLVVRVNPLDQGGDEEIRYLNAFGPDAIRIPKVRTLADVNRAAALIDEPIELHLSIETKEAWLALSELGAHRRVTACYLGILDLFADMQLPQELIEPHNPTLQMILSHFLVTCKCVEAEPVSFVFQEYHNEDAFKEWLTLEKRMGFRSKGCLSPSQVALVNSAFAEDTAARRRAQKIVRLFEAQRSRGVSGFSDDELGFIDEPVYKGALALLQT